MDLKVEILKNKSKIIENLTKSAIRNRFSSLFFFVII